MRDWQGGVKLRYWKPVAVFNHLFIQGFTPIRASGVKDEKPQLERFEYYTFRDLPVDTTNVKSVCKTKCKGSQIVSV